MFTIFLISLLLFCLYLSFRKPKAFPPGPLKLPFVGSLPFIRSDRLFHIMLQNLQRSYGPVVGFYLGNKPAVAVLDRDIMMEALSMEEMQYRPFNFAIKLRSFGKPLGIFFSDGPLWVEQRRFTLRHLRDFGFGKHSMEGLIHDEAMYLIDDIKQESADVGRIDPTQIFSVSVINLLWSIMAGVRYKHDDAKLQEVLNIVKKRMRMGNPTGGFLNAFPILSKIAPKWSGYKAEVNAIREVNNFLLGNIDEHRGSYNPDDMRDYIDVYLKEMESQKGQKTTFTEEQLTIVCSDLFTAGAESVSNSLAFAILHMVLDPKAQQKVQEELDRVVGSDSLPSLTDRPNLHYTEAVMSECLRMSNVAPLMAPHRNSEEVNIRGYTIPKDSMVFFNIHSVHMDKGHWGDPEVFRPERFLNTEGKYVKDDYLIPFGHGKRRCLGEPLASAAYYLFFTVVMQKFSYRVPDGHPKPSLLPLPGFTIAPQPFSVEVKPRT